ncbi:nadh-quinone oxidoreductase subunit f [Holotrichia oblita]|nr:nadh-quinone oxidoreductase subunit f [Holotrichia oblita]
MSWLLQFVASNDDKRGDIRYTYAGINTQNYCGYKTNHVGESGCRTSTPREQFVGEAAMKILIGYGSCGIAAGAEKTATELNRLFAEARITPEIEITGCIGMCYLEPIIDVIDDKGEKKTYVRVDEKSAAEIVKSIAGLENRAEEKVISQEDMDILNRQRNCTSALEKALAGTPKEIIDEIKISGLAGRGGAGFPTWFKWQAARDASGDKKYIICNADEGDRGAFMDRAVIEGDPHCLIEGMLIAAYAIGATDGVVYVRAEYPLAIKRLAGAIAEAESMGYLGSNILNSTFEFNLRIKAGAGAFVCGEETALIASLEGKRGMPRLKPPFPAQKGFWKKPTNINNVETYANVPWIILNGGAEFSKMGTPGSKGTKVFALTGKIKKGGLVEILMGSTIKDVIYNVGGGIKDDQSLKPFKWADRPAAVYLIF